MLHEARLRELLDEATTDCYSDEEELSGILVTLLDNLRFPLRATLAGVPVTVHGLDDRRSALRRGIVAQVEQGGERYYVGLAELEFTNPDRDSAEWVAMYRWWVGQ